MPSPFTTPANELSFSGIVDGVVLATGKPQNLISIVQAVNETIRECQALGLFARDMVEDGLVVPSDNATGQITLDRPLLFRSLRTVKYLTSCEYPELAAPGRKQRDKRYYYYAVDNYFVFNGVCPNETVAYATYYWSPLLGYYGRLGTNTSIFPGGPYSIRPAYYDQNAFKWQYLNADENGYVDTTGDPDEDAARQLLVTNWLCSDWSVLITAGAKAKIWTSAGDPRSGAEFSRYSKLQNTLSITQQYESENY